VVSLPLGSRFQLTRQAPSVLPFPAPSWIQFQLRPDQSGRDGLSPVVMVQRERVDLRQNAMDVERSRGGGGALFLGISV
jgi:hypothetical protein